MIKILTEELDNEYVYEVNIPEKYNIYWSDVTDFGDADEDSLKFDIIDAFSIDDESKIKIKISLNSYIKITFENLSEHKLEQIKNKINQFCDEWFNIMLKEISIEKNRYSDRINHRYYANDVQEEREKLITKYCNKR